jgi:hypothetical protein
MVPDLSGWWCSEERVFPGRERQDERSNLPFPGQGWEGLGSALTGRYARRSANVEDCPLAVELAVVLILRGRLMIAISASTFPGEI